MIRLLNTLPRPVLISLSIIFAAVVIFAILVPVLGGARDGAVLDNAKLTSDIAATKKAITQSQTDKNYVAENKDQYEELLKGDRLVPHTRRAAILELESAARANGLTALTYSIGAVSANSARSADSQPASGDYNVSVENIEIKVGAPIDGSIYRFLVDIGQKFPGSAVIDAVTLSRANFITAEALEAVSQGKDAQLVQGTIAVSWRTAQAKEKTEAEKKGK